MRRRLTFQPRHEALEPRRLLSATAIEDNHIGYFVSPTPGRIERYDLAAEAWLDPVTLQGATSAPTVIAVDANGLYAAYDKAVYRYQLDGSGKIFLINAPKSVTSLHTDGNVAFVNYSRYGGGLVSINKTTNLVVSQAVNGLDFDHVTVGTMSGASIARGINRIFGAQTGSNPATISSLSYDDNGVFAPVNESTYYFDTFPNVNATWTFPDSSKVVDDHGNVFATSNLQHLTSIGLQITDVSFTELGQPVIVSGDSLYLCGDKLLPIGQRQLHSPAAEVFVNDRDALAFRADSSTSTGFAVETVSLGDLATPEFAEPVDPTNLAYTPDKIEVANDGVLLLFSIANQCIFRWNPQTQSYGSTIPLVDSPSYMAYSSTTNTIYVAQASGLIRQISLDDDEPREKPFAAVHGTPLGLATADSYVFALDNTGAWQTQYTISTAGSIVEYVEWRGYSTEYAWSNAKQKMYYLFQDQTPGSLVSEEINANSSAYPTEPPGGIGNEQRSFSAVSYWISYVTPLRVSPDGSYVLTGAGHLFDGDNLAQIPYSLANKIVDATWIGAELYTIYDDGETSQFQHWEAPRFELLKSAASEEKAIAIRAVSDTQLVGISLDDSGVPIFTVLDLDLRPVIIGTNDPPTAVALKNPILELAEDSSTANAIKVADVKVTDDGRGTNRLALSGRDADQFQLVGKTLRLKSGISLDYEVKPSLLVTVEVDDNSVGVTPDVSVNFELKLLDVNEAPTSLSLQNFISSLDANVDTSIGVRLADIVVTDDALGDNDLSISGADAASFQIVNRELRLAPGVVLGAGAQMVYSISIHVDDPSLGPSPDASIAFVLAVLNVWHNSENPADVNQDGNVHALDALLVVNDLNRNGPRSLAGSHQAANSCPDTNGDLTLTALDALLVINELNAPQGLSLQSETEGARTLDALALSLVIDQATAQPSLPDSFFSWIAKGRRKI